MTPNLKVILSAAGVAALVASPALAKSHVRTHYLAPAVPAYGQVYTTPYAERQVVAPYGADTPTAPHEMPGPSHHFQLGGEK
jgi:hypothetical protein